MTDNKELMTGINSFTRDSLKKTKTSESKANTGLFSFSIYKISFS